MEVVINPRDFIHEPFLDCPKCGKPAEYGVLMVNNHSYVRRCRQCWHSEAYSLPELQKKVLYLDQFALSEMMKALDLTAKSHGTQPLQAFWIELFERLDRLNKLQLLVCPESEFHMDESLISPFNDALKKMYHLLSGGVSFLSRLDIECRQLGAACKQWDLGISPPEFTDERPRVLRGDLTGWQDRIGISARFSNEQSWAQGIRTHRTSIQQALQVCFDHWRDTKSSFQDVFESECDDYGRNIVRDTVTYAQSLALARQGHLPADLQTLQPPLSAVKFGFILDVLSRGNRTQAEAYDKAVEFFCSRDLQYIPHVRIAASMFGAIAARISAGMTKQPDEGLATDILAIATSLPYCDAMLVDKQCASILRENPAAKQLNYRTQVFSTTSRQELLEYLDTVEASATAGHRELVDQVYGPKWKIPFTTLYTHGQASDGKA